MSWTPSEKGEPNKICLRSCSNLGQEQAVHGLAWLYDDDQLREAFRPYVDTMVALRTGRYIGMLPAAVRLAREVRKFKPDLLHAKLIRSQLLARLAARLAGGVPVMSTWECVSYDKSHVCGVGTQRPGSARVDEAFRYCNAGLAISTSSLFQNRLPLITRENLAYPVNECQLYIMRSSHRASQARRPPR